MRLVNQIQQDGHKNKQKDGFSAVSPLFRGIYTHPTALRRRVTKKWAAKPLITTRPGVPSTTVTSA